MPFLMQGLYPGTKPFAVTLGFRKKAGACRKIGTICAMCQGTPPNRDNRRGFTRTILAVFLVATARNFLRLPQWHLRKTEKAMSKNENR